jgi:DNA-binding transcriptional ArsR family regulator
MSDAPNARDLDGLRVIAHPLRLRLLSLLSGESLSAAEAARRLGESQANLSYHLRRLAKAGLVDLVEEESVRGGIAKRYRHDPSSGERLSSGGRDEHQALMAAMAAELMSRSRRYLPDSKIVFTDAEVSVRAAVWTRVAELIHEAGKLISETAVPPGEPGTVRIAATLALFAVGTDEVSSTST